MKVPCVRVSKAQGEETRRTLAEAGLLSYDYAIEQAGDWLFIPVTDPTAVLDEYDIVEHDVSPRDRQMMPEEVLEFDPTYERLGDIVLLDEPDPDRAREAAAAMMASDLTVKTVVNKASEVQGEARVRDWEVLAGNGTATVHREYGNEFAVDITEVYFSPRLATERHRVITQVDAGERVVDMFAGVGPFAIPIAKRGATVLAVDSNPAAIKYLRENIHRNQVDGQVTVIESDVRNIVDDYAGWADRIIMNLPHSANQFLTTAVTLASSTCTVHYYDIQSTDDPFTPGITAIREAATDYGVEVLDRRIVRSYSPHEVNVCIDARLTRDPVDRNS